MCQLNDPQLAAPALLVGVEIAQQAVTRPMGRPGDFGWVVLAHGEKYVAEYGWSSAFEVGGAGPARVQ
jgi:hypothetical protein